MKNLAALYYKQEKYQAAAEMFERAIAMMKKKFSGGHPELTRFQKNYAVLKEKMVGR